MTLADIIHETVVVTPALAAEMLLHAPDTQRTTSRSVVKNYAQALRDGTWVGHAQPIQVATDGTVIDGQHRLLAIVESGVAMETVVARGVDPASFGFIDIGRRRAASQFVNGPNAVAITQAANLMLAVEALGPTLVNLAEFARGITIDQTLDAVADNPEIAFLAELVRAVYAATHIHSGTHLAALAQIARGPHEPRIADWCNGLISGADLPAGDARLALRERWLREYRFLNGGGSATIQRRWSLIVRAWNAFVVDEPLKIIKFTKTAVLDTGIEKP